MKNVLFVTGNEFNCGIYQYGDSVFEILKTSKKFNFFFIGSNDPTAVANAIQSFKVKAIIYNHHPWTLSFLSDAFTREVHSMGIKQIVITGHEHIRTFDCVDHHVSTDPRFSSEHPKILAGVLPITYYDDIQYSPPSDVLKIGTSGIGNVTKKLDIITQMINDQFDEEVIFNVHISDGKYVDPVWMDRLKQQVENLKKSNITVNFNTKFMFKKELIHWLNGNDINLYVYGDNHSIGVSGSVDRALASKKPFAVNDSSFLTHLRGDFNDLSKIGIKDIVKNGIAPFQPFYDQWNPERLLNFYEGLLE